MSVELPPPPGLASFRVQLASSPVDKSIEYLIALLRRRQIRGPKRCALATAWLLRKVVSSTRTSESGKLILRVQDVGRRLMEAAPRELTVGNIVRRVLGVIREEEENQNETPAGSDFGSIPPTPANELPQPSMSVSQIYSSREAPRPALSSQPTGLPGDRRPQVTSMFSIMQHPTMRNSAGISSPVRSGSVTPAGAMTPAASSDLRAEILEAITELVDELDQADEQVASYALEHVTPQDTILVQGTDPTVQRFLLKAASKRKFTVIQTESYPNEQQSVHAVVTGKMSSGIDDEEDVDVDSEAFSKTLTSQGITVILVPDSAIFALMPRTTKLLLSATAVLADGSIVAPAGSRLAVAAAKFHRVPVLALAETYKLSPVQLYDSFDFIDYGDIQKLVSYQDEELRLGLSEVRNPTTEAVDGKDITLFVTNVGGVGSAGMYRIVREQYHDEDLEL